MSHSIKRTPFDRESSALQQEQQFDSVIWRRKNDQIVEHVTSGRMEGRIEKGNGRRSKERLHARRLHVFGRTHRTTYIARLQRSFDARGLPHDGVLRFVDTKGNRRLEFAVRREFILRH